MFFKFILLGIALTGVLFFTEVLLPKIKSKYKHYKEQKMRQKRRDAFRKKMNELEIK